MSMNSMRRSCVLWGYHLATMTLLRRHLSRQQQQLPAAKHLCSIHRYHSHRQSRPRRPQAVTDLLSPFQPSLGSQGDRLLWQARGFRQLRHPSHSPASSTREHRHRFRCLREALHSRFPNCHLRKHGLHKCCSRHSRVAILHLQRT